MCLLFITPVYNLFNCRGHSVPQENSNLVNLAEVTQFSYASLQKENNNLVNLVEVTQFSDTSLQKEK